MSKFDNNIELGPHVASDGLPQWQSQLQPPPESQEDLNVAPVFINATQTTPPPEDRYGKRRRCDPDELANWREEQDPVRRRRRANAHYRRQCNKRRRTQTDARNEASTEESFEVQQAEDTMDQPEDTMDHATQSNGG